MGDRKVYKSSLIPFPVIAAAVNGDIDAINGILKHFGGYINTLSTKRLYDEYGNSYLLIDERLRSRLEAKLTAAILTFSLA